MKLSDPDKARLRALAYESLIAIFSTNSLSDLDCAHALEDMDKVESLDFKLSRLYTVPVLVFKISLYFEAKKVADYQYIADINLSFVDEFFITL